MIGTANRTNKVTINLSDEEKQLLQTEATKIGLPLAIYIRLGALQQTQK